MRRAAKRDAVEAGIVATLRRLGCSVYAVSATDFPDLVVALPNGDTLLAEVKTERAKLKPGQAYFAANWKGRIIVLRSIDDALALVQKRAETLPPPPSMFPRNREQIG